MWLKILENTEYLILGKNLNLQVHDYLSETVKVHLLWHFCLNIHTVREERFSGELTNKKILKPQYLFEI